MTSQQQITVSKLEKEGYYYVYMTEDDVMVSTGTSALYIKTDGTYKLRADID